MDTAVRRKGASVARGRKAAEDARTVPSEHGKLQNLNASYVVYFSAFVGSLTSGVDELVRIFETCSHALAPYHPNDLIIALYGLILCFFGGVFMTLLAAAEAAQLFGSDKITIAFKRLGLEWNRARRAFERDAQLDENRNGIPDVNELAVQDLAMRRFTVLCRSVDPENLSMALEGLTEASLAILATLRVQFAKAITIGTAIGDELNRTCGPWITSAVDLALPDEYAKWSPILCRYGTRWIGISLSWIFVRLMASVYSSTKGASLFITGMTGYLMRYGYMTRDVGNQRGPLLLGAWLCMAFAGVYWQVSEGFRLPFPINLLLLPLTIAESVLAGVVGSKDL